MCMCGLEQAFEVDNSMPFILTQSKRVERILALLLKEERREKTNFLFFCEFSFLPFLAQDTQDKRRISEFRVCTPLLFSGTTLSLPFIPHLFVGCWSKGDCVFLFIYSPFSFHSSFKRYLREPSLCWLLIHRCSHPREPLICWIHVFILRV